MASKDDKKTKPDVGSSVKLGNGQTMTTTSYEDEGDGDFTIGFVIE